MLDDRSGGQQWRGDFASIGRRVRHLRHDDLHFEFLSFLFLFLLFSRLAILFFLELELHEALVRRLFDRSQALNLLLFIICTVKLLVVGFRFETATSYQVTWSQNGRSGTVDSV